ncbi:superoxide dismutase [Cu-Zn] SodC [Solimicrobium silvestre]|uniref:Superoxide dismutase [Cu-Zn] n=1 Tax=Solimicrobium silvestre TaxID=2099400 RepID=A0A2S9H5J1_9BURK|nr:superoxide dismutase [Cu-Zn] SodC [Solimicrobium silvestre]PRC95259.1 Cu/Zn superoxide dismutase [Solimicrobium silvestre]
MKSNSRMMFKLSSALLITMVSASALATEIIMNEVDAAGKVTAVGSVMLTETPYGVLFTPNLKNLPAGMHGFHLHEKSNCGNTTTDSVVMVAGAAGGHWDPEHTLKHEGPYGQGHLGDLPSLYVAADGTATIPVLAPRIKDLSQVHGLALMVHAGGDNHSDHPAKLGGGGVRIACGLVN